MTELEKLKRAKMYLERLANGINPLTEAVIEDNDVINNVRISRCLFYVSGVLEKVIQNGGEVKKTVVRSMPFSITEEQLQRIKISEDAVGITIITGRINAVLDEDAKKIYAPTITTWLVNEGYLSEFIRGNKKSKEATQKGESIGLFTVDAVNQNGVTYRKTLYNASAQQFVINNIMQIFK